jgi:hypothetical protein
VSEELPSARVQGRTTSPARVVAVTAGLSVFGSIVGAAAGAAALFFGVLLNGQFIDDAFFVLELPAIIGAVLGAILTPIAGWMLLRRVPLGRAFAGLAAGTIGGGVLGWLLLARHMDPIVGSVGSAVIGFLTAAIAMRYSKSARMAAAD